MSTDAMRIVLDVRTVADHFPGVGRYAFHLARAIARQESRGELVLVSHLGASNSRFDLAGLASHPGVRMAVTSAKPVSFREQLLMPDTLRNLNPAVTHFPYPVLPYLAPRPIALTIHDIIPLKYPQFFTRRQRILYRISLWMALRAAAVIVCVSEATRADLISFFRVEASRAVVIHEGVGESFHPCSAEEIEHVRAEYAIPQKYCLYVGSNKPHKNLPALIRAWAGLKSFPALVLAGGQDPRFGEARRQVQALGLQNRIHFLGNVREGALPVLYSGAQAFVFPSLCEGFGLPPVEAMACGIPVACSDIPSLREAAGEAAVFFDPNKSEAIGAAMERILTDQSLREELRTKGLQRAAELSWDLAARKTLEAYRKAGGR